MQSVDGARLRTEWVRLVTERGPLTCDQVLIELRAKGQIPKGLDRKAWIRNLHSAATSEPRLVKVRPGLFGLVDD
jgi:hypothetical protein